MSIIVCNVDSTLAIFRRAHGRNQLAFALPIMPERAVVHLQGKPLSGFPGDEGMAIYEMLPSGDFILETSGVEPS